MTNILCFLTGIHLMSFLRCLLSSKLHCFVHLYLSWQWCTLLCVKLMNEIVFSPFCSFTFKWYLLILSGLGCHLDPLLLYVLAFGLDCSSFSVQSCFSSKASMTPTTGYNTVLTWVFCLIWLWVGFAPTCMDHITHYQWELCNSGFFSSEPGNWSRRFK